MGKIGICLLLIYTIFIQGTFSGECKPEDHMTMEKKLHAKLMCNYRNDVRPVLKFETVLNITTKIMVLSLRTSFNKANVNSVTMYTATVVEWTDEYLKWNPKDYDKINDIVMDSSLIWKPEISIIDDDKQIRQYITKPCSVFSTGEVSCTEKFTYKMQCSKTYKDWPYDKHNCSSVFGIWMAKEHSDILFDESEIDIEEPQPNKYWKLLSVSVSSADEIIKNLRHPRIEINIEIERNSVIVKNSYLLPIAAMIIMSLTSFFLNINSAERMVMILYNIYLHFQYLENITYNAPSLDDDLPNAVIYVRDSMFLSCGILICTMLLINISKQTDMSPRWIKTVNETMRSQIVGKIIMFEDTETTSASSVEPDDDDDDTPKVEEKSPSDKSWETFARILNRLFFIGVVVIYGFFILRFLI